jgi:non-specific serine/threonine protein kinase
MNAEACAAGQAAGRALSLYEAIEDALGGDGSEGRAVSAGLTTGVPAGRRPGSATAAMPAGRPPPSVTDELSLREQEVAALVARGLTNRQIAAELVIAVGTASNHVKHILARLGLESRVQIAAWAIEHGLHRPSDA